MPTYFYFQSVWLTILAIGSFVVHIFFALAVLSDAVKLQDEKGQEMVFVSGKIWALATLFGGVFIAVAYWVIHHSTLSPKTSSNSAPLN